MDAKNLPDFDDLPPVEGMPQGSAWGIFDKDGKKDTLGCLNLLTPAVVKAAYSEARDGVSISLNHSMDINKLPTGRAKTEHKCLTWKEDIMPGNCNFLVNDDEVSFNTQASSQWDGFLHYPHQATGLCYNGISVTREQLHQQSSDTYDPEKKVPSLDHWHDRGGVVGRGVLLDYRAYAEAKGIKYDPMTRHIITIADLEAIAVHQGTELKPGDILIIRSGAAEDMAVLSAEQQLQKVIASQGGMIGVEGTEEAAKWFWNKHFAAVAGDMMAFEVYPPEKPDGSFGDTGNLVLHSYFLCMFGLNIGEVWSVKALGEHCAKIGRYSFLFTSAPLNIPGLIASPINALALF